MARRSARGRGRILFGRGLVDPPDDVRVSNPASHPALLRELARRVVEYRYDLRRLIRELCASRTYQLAARDDDVPAALLYSAAATVVAGFQLALAAGAPWGDRAMGGRYPGRLPPAVRVAEVVQAAVQVVLALVVLDAAGVVALGWAIAHPWLPWVPVVVALLSTALNAVTRSRPERQTWLPVASAMLMASLVVAA